MATIRDVLHNYFRLRTFCDSIVDKVTHGYADQIACRPGCCGCCTLTGVNMLEAAVLLQAMAGQPGMAPRSAAPPSPAAEPSCLLLRDNQCSLYPARPLICRTHGLPLRGASLTRGRVDCCPMNFKAFDLSAMKPGCVLDVEEVTMNLMRFNLAFCMLLGDRHLADERLSMQELLAGNVPSLLAEALQKPELP